jgi:hypothetical protein
MLHSGIDLHKNDLVIGTLIKQRHLRTERSAVSEYFCSLPGPHRWLAGCETVPPARGYCLPRIGQPLHRG